MTTERLDRGARALTERIEAIWPVLESAAHLADAILANGAVFIAHPLDARGARREVEGLPDSVSGDPASDGRFESGWVNRAAVLAIIDRLADADELERLRRIEAAARASMTAWTGMRAEATKFKVWSEADETIYQSPVQSDLRAALEPEGSAQG